MENKSTVEKLAEHFKEMSQASPDKVKELANQVDDLLNMSRDRFNDKLIAAANLDLAKKLNLI